MSGRVIWFTRARGYGFIKPDLETEPDVFVHARDVVGRKDLFADDRVEFEVLRSRYGGTLAQKVRRVW